MLVRTKILVGVGALLAAVAALAVATVQIAQHQARSALTINRAVTERATPARELAGLAKDIRYHVVQVQQYLTDASATRELADDEASAAEHAAAFDQDSKRALQVAGTIGSAAARELLDQARRAFPGYYATGLRMAHAYIDHGLEAGNAVMKEFDPETDTIAQLTVKLDELASREADDSAAAVAAEVVAQTVSAARVRAGAAAIGLLFALSCVGASIALLRGFVRPLSRLAETTHQIGSGETATFIPGAQRQDEIGVMAAALAKWQEATAQAAAERALNEAAQQQAFERRHAALADMAERVEGDTAAAITRITASSDTSAATTDEMHASATRTGVSAQGAASAAAQALANAQTVASAAEELSASIREIGSRVGESTAVVARAVHAGSETRRTIEALNEQVGQIGTVAHIIGEIAAKTNLLALNATIEAARAGEAGKGFAVVASEVKQLATQTAHSTDAIARHIAEVRTATDASVKAVERIEQTIGEVNAIASSIAAAVEQQSAATAEISRNVTQTSAAAGEMTARITEVATEAESTGRRAAEVQKATQDMRVAVQELRHAVVRAVRTSTTDVNRRNSERTATNLPGTLRIPGQAAQAVRISDLSSGGACILAASPLAVGTRGLLELSGVASSLPFTVRATEGDILHVAFALDDAALAKLAPTLQRIASASGLAAA
jgi:methyl-accepting chemotaxis protein